MAGSAKRNNPKGDSFIPWVSKLKDLSKMEDKTKLNEGIYRSNYPSLIYGYWLRMYEYAEEKVRKACFRAKVLEALDLLDDDDPTNDQGGYITLAQILFLAGYRQHATAAFAIALKPLELFAAERAQSTQAPMEEKAGRKPEIRYYGSNFSCRGQCGLGTRRRTDYKEIYACEICYRSVRQAAQDPPATF